MQSDIVQRLRAASQGMRSHYKVGAVELIPTHTMDEAAAEITRLTEALRAAEESEKGFVDALIWCSGSADFNEGGQARNGWLKLCRPLIDAALAGAKP